MAQTKKDGVREAILQAAFGLFSEVGYSETSIPAIAAAAGISTANVYRYFPSKLQILYTLYEPWLVARLDELGAALARIADPRKRLEKLLLALWRELPRATNGFANNVMQALSTSGRNDAYDPHLRQLFQGRVATWIADATALSARESRTVAGVALMAFDGFAMNVHLPVGIACDAATARLMARTLIGPGAP
ncbi:MAG: TetR/AcrR family transcriptional regulator [Burkholderiales bacterium]|nr:TetR/AcrR family transcriptional regulator [Burkholderiales bacterium]